MNCLPYMYTIESTYKVLLWGVSSASPFFPSLLVFCIETTLKMLFHAPPSAYYFICFDNFTVFLSLSSWEMEICVCEGQIVYNGIVLIVMFFSFACSYTSGGTYCLIGFNSNPYFWYWIWKGSPLLIMMFPLSFS